MQVDLDKVAVEDNPAEGRFEARVGGHLAMAEYMRAGDRIVFTHTEVLRALSGHGLADKIVHTALEQARAEHLAVIPLCPFVASYIRRHQEYVDLVDPEYRSHVSRG